MFSWVKKIFSKKNRKPIEPDGIKNEITFTDINKSEVIISVKHVGEVDLLFIKNRDSDEFILIDQESAILLQAIMADFVKGGNIKNIAKLIGGK